MSAIIRGLIYTKEIPDNLGVIFRKTARSLNDSTLRDFQSYTNLTVGSDRNITYPNGSAIMFRHLDEIDSINQQNLNLGWFYLEQGEELDSNREFFMLFGRLRRTLTPTDEFIARGLPLRSGWVVGNAGDNWMLPLFKEGQINAAIGEEARALLSAEKYAAFCELTESRTLDAENAKILKPDFKASLLILQKVNPQLFAQYVANDWTITTRNVVFTGALVNLMHAKDSLLARHSDNAGVSVDPAGEGADDVGLMSGRGGDVLDAYAQASMRPTEVALRAVQMCRAVNGHFIIVDCDGVGIATWQELMALPDDYRHGIHIIKFHGSAPSELVEMERIVYRNQRTEAAFVAQKRGWRGQASVNVKDTALIEELKAEEYEIRNGVLQLLPKKDIKERIGRSPWRADCWKMLQWGFEQRYESVPIYDWAQNRFLGGARQQREQTSYELSETLPG